MKLTEILSKIEGNQDKIATFGKFETDLLKKINYKFRLDWNYYSNRIEGGTLTREETRSVMVGNIDVQGKPLRDVMEMNGHDTIVREVLKIGKGDLRLSEKRIKEVHTAIMYQEDEKLKAKIGKWKSHPNEIIGYKNEKISFAEPYDVPELMHDLLNRTNAALDQIYQQKSSTPNPVILASNFHIDYVTIHPFFDGNGRTARIFTNLILISCGLPVIIIKDQHKDAYSQYLGDIQGYGGDRQLFHEFIALRVIDSQELILNALEGKNLEEDDDLKKKIHQLKVELASKDQVSIPQSWENLNEIFTDNIIPFLTQIEENTKPLEDLFNEVSPNISLNLNSHLSNLGDPELWRQNIPNFLASLKEEATYKSLQTFRYGLQFKGFKNNLERQNFSINIEFQFSEYHFSIIDPNNKEIKFPYKVSAFQEYSEHFVKIWVEKLIEEIRSAGKLE